MPELGKTPKQLADARYRAEHAEELAAYKKAWHARNKERISAERKAKHAADPLVRKSQSRRDYEKRSEKIKAAAKAWVEKYPDRKKATDKGYYVRNSNTIVARSKGWREANPEWKAENDRLWVKANPLKVKLNKARRRSRVRLATPKWVTRQELDDVYLEAMHMQLHVDHIIPLVHPLVCGLHVAGNLQLLTHSANARKSNKFDPETFDARQ